MIPCYKPVTPTIPDPGRLGRILNRILRSMEESRVFPMTMIDSLVFRRGIAVLAAALFVPFSHAQNPRLHDDRQITLASAEDVAKKRQQLINFIFGPTGLAAGKLPVVEKNDASPVRGLRGLARVDTLTIAMEADQKSYAHHFIPKRPDKRLVVLFDGKWSFVDLGRAITGTPISTPGGVFAPASAGGLLLHDGDKWFERGGTFD